MVVRVDTAVYQSGFTRLEDPDFANQGAASVSDGDDFLVDVTRMVLLGLLV